MHVACSQQPASSMQYCDSAAHTGILCVCPCVRLDGCTAAHVSSMHPSLTSNTASRNSSYQHGSSMRANRLGAWVWERLTCNPQHQTLPGLCAGCVCMPARDSTQPVCNCSVSYDVVRCSATDGSVLRKWGSQGTGNCQFQQNPRVAVDSAGNVLVSNAGILLVGDRAGP